MMPTADNISWRGKVTSVESVYLFDLESREEDIHDTLLDNSLHKQLQSPDLSDRQQTAGCSEALALEGT